MATQIEIYSTNYSGQTADITFYPQTGGTVSIGVQTIPYIYTNDYYYGTYDLFFSAYNKTCQLVIVQPTPTPTVTMTPTPTSTPTIVGYPYNLQSAGAAITSGMTFMGNSSGYTLDPNTFISTGGFLAFDSIDSNNVDRLSYYSPITGSTTLYLSQGSNIATFAVSPGAFTFNPDTTGAYYFLYNYDVPIPGLITQLTTSAGLFTYAQPIYIGIV